MKDKLAIVCPGPSILKNVDYIKNNFGDNIICVNNTYKLFTKKLAVVSSDSKWWNEFYHEIPKSQAKFSIGEPNVKIENLKRENFDTQLNSGCLALYIAFQKYKCCNLSIFGADLTNSFGSHFFGDYKNFEKTQEKRYTFFKIQYLQCLNYLLYNNCKIYIEPSQKILFDLYNKLKKE